MTAPLEAIFEESIEQVRAREQNALQSLLDARSGKVVLVGAGTLGRRALSLLRKLGATVLAFSDNNSAAWGKQVEGIGIVAPEDAALAYGRSALFLVSIWNDRHWFKETYDQFSALGCTLVSSYAPLFWRFPNDFLQLILLNEPPHRLYQSARAVLDAEKLWCDQASLDIYRANIRWRALGDGIGMPPRPKVNTYFPEDLFRLNETDCLIDAGAFDGDTIRQALESYPAGFDAIHAIEADAISFARLEKSVASLPADFQAGLHLYQCAIGAEKDLVRFDSDGTVNARVSESGMLVEMVTLDELFSQIPVTFIKMDIEGAEYDALLGARNVLQRDRPILAICVYHTQSDIWRIPLLVHEQLPEQLLFLRAYEGDGFQTVLYAVPPERRSA